MKIVISPAKTLDFETPLPVSDYSMPLFLEEAAKINEVLRDKDPDELAKLMSISGKLAELNWKRNQEWHLPFTPENSRQAVYAFKGEVFVGLDAFSIPADRIGVMQKQLRILSGQYGMLRPLDLIQPYRLEMGTKLKIGNTDNLYRFWGDSITRALNDEMQDDEPLVNLASNEYFKVLNKKLLKAPVFTPVFKDYKNGSLKVISFYAKKARGMMTRFIIDHALNNPEDLKAFNEAGYLFDSKLSTATTFVFTR